MAKLDYWQRRQAEDMVRYIQSADDTADDIALLYQQASSYIAGKVDDIFEKYRSKHSLSEQEALLLLNTMQDKTSLEELLEKLRSGNADETKKELLAKLEAPAYSARIEHFKQLQEQIDDIAVSIYRQEKQRQTSHYEELAQEAYYRSTYNVQQDTGIDFEFSDVKAKTIEQVINRRWSGKNYSERIWKNTQELAQDLKQELLINLVTGRSNREAAIVIQKKYATGSMEARRLVWTESCYIAAEMNAIAYEEMGIEKYRFCAVLDLKTSAICREMDTKEFLLKDRAPGKNCPPMHPWCRSCIIPVIDGEVTDGLKRRTRDTITHKVTKLPYDMTYKQWYEKYVKGKPFVEIEEKKIKNMSADRKQWKKYRAILKDKIPDSLDKFQDMKYNELEKWKYMKLDYRRRNQLIKNPELKLPNAENAVAPDKKFTNYLFGGENPDGLAKGKLFESRLGYSINNWNKLQKEILNNATIYPASYKDNNGYGDRYEQKMVLYGCKGTPANVIVGWLYKVDGSISMTSAYIKEVSEWK